MISHQKLIRRKNSSALAPAQYMMSEYYLDEKREAVSVCRWDGFGAQKLGLTGAVKQEDLEKLLDGYSPQGKKLRKNAGKTGAKMADDLTFSADKSISILFASATPEEQRRLMEAGDRACSKTIEWMREQMTTGKGKDRKAVDGLVIARFTHFSSREGEPNLHWHNAVMNFALDENGKFRAFDNKKFLDLRNTAGALFRAEYAREIRVLGYVTEKHVEKDSEARETGQIWHHVKGIGRTVQRHFSTRRAQIEARMAQTGESAQAACLATRKDKEELSYSETMSRARDALDFMRDSGAIEWSTADDLKGQVQEDERVSEAKILENLHRTESSWTRQELIEEFAKQHGGRLGLDEVLAETDRFLERAQVRELASGVYCSDAHLQTEQAIQESARTRMQEQSIRLNHESVAKAIEEHEQAQGFTLTDEQRKAVNFVTSETGGLAVVQGYAGSGKTSTAGAYIRAFEADGRKVYGCSVGWDAAKKLEAEANIESFSALSLINQLDKGKLKLDEKSVLLIDEAGMMGAKQLRAIQAHADKAGAKLVLVGDMQQLQAVEAASGLALVISEAGDTKQTEIRRQKDEEQRAISNLFYKHATGAKIIEAMEKQGQIKLSDTVDDARRELVQAYIADERAAHEKVIIAPTNAQVDAITFALREELKACGEIRECVRVEVKGKLLDERKQLELGLGDRVRFTAKDKALDVVNGSGGVVESIEARGAGHVLRVRLQSDIEKQNGRLVEVDTTKFNALTHAWAGTVHKSQGQSKQAAYWLANGSNIDRNLGLVAATRHKNALHIFCTENGKEDLADSLNDWRMKKNATDYLKKPEAEKQGKFEKFLEQFKQTMSDTRDKLKEHFSSIAQHRTQTKEREQVITYDRSPSPTRGRSR